MLSADNGMAAELENYAQEMRTRIGQVHKRYLGRLERITIQRYARAIGDDNPVYLDVDAAREAGHERVIAPPNLLSGIMEWGDGRAEEDLRPDGTYRPGSTNTLRVMGAGEEMELIRPVPAGSEIWLEDAVESVVVKQGRSGALVFVTVRHDFVDEQGSPYNRNRRTVMARA